MVLKRDPKKKFEKLKLHSGTEVKKLDQRLNSEDLNSLIFSIPFTLSVNASICSGKSTLLLNTLTSTDILAGRFNKIIYICPTSKLDTKVKQLGQIKHLTIPNYALYNKLYVDLPKSLGEQITEGSTPIKSTPPPYNYCDIEFHEKLDLNLFKELQDYQTQIMDTFGHEYMDKILIICDDTIAEKRKWTSEFMKDFVFKSGHYLISMIITSQAYKSIPLQIRTQMKYVILFRTPNFKELENIYEENNADYSKKEWLALYNSVVEEPFKFVVINKKNQRGFGMQSGFDQYVTFDKNPEVLKQETNLN